MVARVIVVAARLAVASFAGFAAAVGATKLLNRLVGPVSCMPIAELVTTCLTMPPWVLPVALVVGLLVMVTILVLARRLGPGHAVRGSL